MDTKKTILIVDDEAILVDLLQFQLTAKGYHVLTACDGRGGLEELSKTSPDLIILDINMPHIGGLEFYTKITDEQGLSQYPVLVLTARTLLEKTFKDIKAAGFMSKPFEINELIDEVDRITADKPSPEKHS